MKKIKLTHSLLFKCTLIFGIFTVIVLIIAGVMTFVSQTSIYKRQCEENIRSIGIYLADLMENEGDDIKVYQDYYMENFDDLLIPYDFDEYATAWAEYETLFADTYPGKTLGEDIDFDELSDEVKRAYFTYTHEYWLLTFEKAREAFNIPYSYYLVMKEDIHDVVYMIDGERTKTERNGKEYLYLGDEYYNDPEEYAIMWRTWETGEKQDGYMEFDNSWGNTYCYYTPLIINGEKLGLIGTEIEVADVNKEILSNTLRQLLGIGAVLVLAMILMLVVINARFIKRTRNLERAVARYAADKDPQMAEVLRRDYAGRDEISSLGQETAEMIEEIEEHINNLAKTAQDLAYSQQYAAEMDDLANRDAMTGVRNKLAYDKEIRHIEAELREGKTRFGVAMVDLNNLKQINDKWGHDRGDEAIKKLCRMICENFTHSAVFRIGGDEFAVILKNDDYRFADSYIMEFNRALDETAEDNRLNAWERTQAAIGYAIYEEGKDDGYASVFRRADQAMYERKKMMKAVRSA